MKISKWLRGPVPENDWFIRGLGLLSVLLFLLTGLVTAFCQTTSTLSVTADGTQPFSYSWKKDGVTIAGATAKDLVLSPLTSSSSGLYLASVVNAAGSATAPANVVVLASSTTAAVDLSKQSAELTLGTSPWSPAVAVFPQFVIVPLKKVLDPGNHFNDATGIYTVGAGEGGTYVIEMTVRTQDQPPFDVSIGLTSGTTNADDHTLWVVTPAKPTDPNAYLRFGTEHTNTRKLDPGAQIRCNIFVQSPIQIIGYEVTIWRKY